MLRISSNSNGARNAGAYATIVATTKATAVHARNEDDDGCGETPGTVFNADRSRQAASSDEVLANEVTYAKQPAPQSDAGRLEP